MSKSRISFSVLLIALSLSVGFKTIQSYSDSKRSSSIEKDSIKVQQPSWQVLYDSLGLAEKGLSEKAFAYAWYGFQKMKFTSPVLAIADFSQSSTKKRLYIVDLAKEQLLLNTYVAHGRNSGNEYARSFSNTNESYQSSLGFYRTLGTYQGKHGLSLRLEGLERGINDHALQRAIVMHGADYVSESFIRNTGRLGRSLGCPAVPMKDHKKVINLLYNGAGLFIYSKDTKYHNTSKLLAAIEDNIIDDYASGERFLYTSSR
ncbi:murein L,D-transpeptidase catalytic domain family protein [Dyadobacter tibetensis]|uniref:murein L,D-transpeptidase catalytic domain family protein n=1 Tax=Dyadobacter tibetensis TaxID=1211851 RepID=UPI00046F6397|nr:murein L,D-transpeptidase catalytic domain family protein [Dyadobacter tibetensis]